MANERAGGSAQTDQESVLAERGGPSLPRALRLQILTTEHWSLSSTRGLTWNEALSRATMFLAVLSGAVLAASGSLLPADLRPSRCSCSTSTELS
jgi:hypothetical protein